MSNRNGSGRQPADVEMDSETEQRTAKNLKKLDESMEEDCEPKGKMRSNLK